MSGKLQKSVKQLDVLFLAVGALIGFAVFVLPGDAFLIKSGPWGAWIGVGVGAILTIIVAYSYGYLIKKYPLCGGSFTFTILAFKGESRKKHAFISAWFLLIAYVALLCINGAGCGLVVRYIFPGVFSQTLLYQVAGWDVYLGEILVSVITIAFFGIVNMKGMKTSTLVQNAVVCILLGSFLIVLSITLLGGVDLANFSPAYPSGKTSLSSILSIVCLSPFLFMGYDVIPQAAEEYRFSPKQAMALMVISILIAAFVLSGLTFISASVIPWTEMISAKHFWGVGWAVETIAGRAGLLILGAGMICGIFSGINAFYTTASRVLLAMARADAMPAVFGDIDPKHGTPKKAILAIMLVSLISPFFGRQIIIWIVDMVAAGMAITYAYSTISAALIAKEEDDKFAYGMSIAGFIISLFFLGLQIIPGAPGFLPTPSLIILVVWCVLGIILYLYKRKEYNSSDKIDTLLNAI